jgi:hypothetical protein
MDSAIISALIASVIGGVVVAILNFLFTKGKTNAEIKKLEAETDKTKTETEKMRLELKNLADTVKYKLAETTEITIYDSGSDCDPHHFEGKEGQFFDTNKWKHSGSTGRGRLIIDEQRGIINIQRTNKEGRYELWLRHYLYNNGNRTILPGNEIIAGKRKLRISFEAKAVGGSHHLRFVLKDDKTKDWLANEKLKIARNDWVQHELFFHISPTANCVLRIDNEDVSHSPSSVQIRNLVFAEKVS